MSKNWFENLWNTAHSLRDEVLTAGLFNVTPYLQFPTVYNIPTEIWVFFDSLTLKIVALRSLETLANPLPVELALTSQHAWIMTRLLLSDCSIPPHTHTHTLHIWNTVHKRTEFYAKMPKNKSTNSTAFYGLPHRAAATWTSAARGFWIVLANMEQCYIRQYVGTDKTVESSGCQPVEHLPQIDIHFRMEAVVGMCRHQSVLFNCGLLSATLRA
jgi:hypothetical protein